MPEPTIEVTWQQNPAPTVKPGQRVAIIRAHSDQHIALDSRCSVVAATVGTEPGAIFIVIVGPDDVWDGAPDDGKGLYS